MTEYILKFLSWIWNNISNIDSTISIIVLIGGTVISLAIRLIRFLVRHNQLKYFVLDRQTKQAIKNYVPTRGTGTDPCDQED